MRFLIENVQICYIIFTRLMKHVHVYATCPCLTEHVRPCLMTHGHVVMSYTCKNMRIKMNILLSKLNIGAPKSQFQWQVLNKRDLGHAARAVPHPNLKLFQFLPDSKPARSE